jgi:hypothetical protein
MVSLGALWLPIVLSAVVVFVVSSVIHMVLTYHRSDVKQIPNEDRVAGALRGENLAPGLYILPYCATPKEMGTPQMLEKYKQGPVAMVTMLPNGPPAMPKFLGQWFAFSLLVGVFAAYLASRTVAMGAEYLAVFRVVGVTAFLGYAGPEMANSIWRGQSWSTTWKNYFDGLVYALFTAGVFGWLWPR